MKFVQINYASSEPITARDGHASAVLGSKLFVFGGFQEGDDGDPVCTNELLVYDMSTATFSVGATRGVVPSARSGCAMFAHDDKLFVFGGFSIAEGWFSDLFCVQHIAADDVYEWQRVDTAGPTPLARDKLGCVVQGDAALLFGGFGPATIDADDNGFGDGQSFQWHDSCHKLQLDTMTWSVVASSSAPRLCAAGVDAADGVVWLFGGSGAPDPALRSAALLSAPLAEPMQWSERTASDAPSGRSFVGLVAWSGCVAVFGGKGRDNAPLGDLRVFRRDAWSVCGGSAPPARSFFTLTRVDEQRALLFGGAGDGGTRFSDLWLLLNNNDDDNKKDAV